MGRWLNSWRSFWAETRWLSVGIGIKRWLLLLGVGAGLTGMGTVYLVLVLHRSRWLPTSIYDILTLQFWPIWMRILFPLLFGVAVILLAVFKIGTNLLAPFRQPGRPVSQALYDYSRQGRGPNVVAIGGGTGMPNLLRGLTRYTSNITAIVTVADDGGSSGRLRKEFGLLPPGDFRNNIAALSRDEMLMTRLLQYRFGGAVSEDSPGELRGHAFGNLLLAALTGVTGSFDEGLLAAERVLAMRGRVLPSTLENVALAADVVSVEDGDPVEVKRIVGESNIPRSGGRIRRVSLVPSDVRAYPPAVQAILQADLVLIGPGSLYTSILPNLLVPALATALQHTRATRVYICNLATQPGETDNYSVADHVSSILRHVPDGCLDMVLANDNQSIPADTGGGSTIYVKLEEPATLRMIRADLVDVVRPWRHDADKLASAAMGILNGTSFK